MRLAQSIREAVPRPGSVALFYLAQAGFCIKTGAGAVVYVDPYLTDSCERLFGFKRLIAAPITPAEAEADVVASTHAHADHLDPDALPVIARNPRTRFLGSPDCEEVYRRCGLARERYTILRQEETATLAGVGFRATYADHGELAPDAIGLLISVDGVTIYNVGDSAYRPQKMAASLNCRVDVMISPINGQFGNMDAVETCRLAAIIKPKVLIAAHFGMFAEHGGDVEAFLEAARALPAGIEARVMAPGELLTYPGQCEASPCSVGGHVVQRCESPLVVRLNSTTCAMIPPERDLLASINARVIEVEGTSDEEIAEVCRDCDAVMVVSAHLRAPVIEALAKCRIISRLGTGVDKIDVAQATRQGVMVSNLPDFCTNEVADHTVALLLAAARQLDLFQAQMRQGKQPHQVADMHRLSTRTLGIIGLGRIGKAVARRARAFGMRILASDPNVSPEDARAVEAELVDLGTLLAESDYLCLLCPLTEATREMLTLDEMRKMKPSAVFINTGRGELVKENDLIVALKTGVIRYAAIDVFAGINVFDPGGFTTDHPYFALDNIMMTPHVAAYSEESALEQKVRGAQAVVEVLSGKWPQHLVNPEVVPWFEIAQP